MLKLWHLLAAALVAATLGASAALLLAGNGGGEAQPVAAVAGTNLPPPTPARVTIGPGTASAKANVREALPAVEMYYVEHRGSYMGVSAARLHSLDKRIGASVAIIGDTEMYCIQSSVVGGAASETGAAGRVVPSLCGWFA